MNQSRGFLDYGMIWAVAIVSVLISLLFYQAIVMAEHRLQRRLGQPSG
jgi:ABC-type nitrate/sulfonate/bicarbonate transport system permease component